VDICEKLKEHIDTPFHWYVVGDGPDYDETVALAHEHGVEDVLTFVGEQENPYAIVKQSDFTVLTSKSEAYPMVVIESFVLGKPIVVAKYGSSFEMIQHGQNGLVAEQSVESLTESVERMIENRDGIRDKCKSFLRCHEIDNVVSYNQFIESAK
jgi:glycosyltransferase involved in cell wall biosynthesis